MQKRHRDGRTMGFHIERPSIEHSEFETLVVQGLSLMKNAVAQSDPDESSFELALPTLTDARDTRLVADEVARRIQVLSPGWDVWANSCGASNLIMAQRIQWGRGTGSRLAAGFDISDVQNDKLIEAGPAIIAAVTIVQLQTKAVGTDKDSWEVQFPTNGPSLFVLRQAARRMQYYSPYATIVADEARHSIKGTRISIPASPANLALPPNSD